MSSLEPSSVSMVMPRAREIFEIHLPTDRTYRPDPDGVDTRREIIERATSRLYSPNAGTEIANVTLRDGSRRTVHAPSRSGGRSLTGAGAYFSTTGPGAALRVDFEVAQRAVAPGQYVVFYDGEHCLGGAVIDQIHRIGGAGSAIMRAPGDLAGHG